MGKYTNDVVQQSVKINLAKLIENPQNEKKSTVAVTRDPRKSEKPRENDTCHFLGACAIASPLCNLNLFIHRSSETPNTIYVVINDSILFLPCMAFSKFTILPSCQFLHYSQCTSPNVLVLLDARQCVVYRTKREHHIQQQSGEKIK